MRSRAEVADLLLIVCICTAAAQRIDRPPGDELQSFMQAAGFGQAAIHAALHEGITLADLHDMSVGELGEFLQSHRLGSDQGRSEWRRLSDSTLPESEESRDALLFYARWHELQFVADCDAVESFWVMPLPEAQIMGLGGILHAITNTMRRAMHEGRLMVFDDRTIFHYANPHAGCPNRTLDCYLLPLSSCTTADVERRFPRSSWSQDWTNGSLPVVWTWLGKASFRVPYKDLLPPGLSQEYGHGWPQALMLGLVLRPNLELAQFINKISSQIGMDSTPTTREPLLGGPHSPPLMRRCISVKGMLNAKMGRNAID